MKCSLNKVFLACFFFAVSGYAGVSAGAGDGTLLEYPLPTKFSYPLDVIADKNGTVWFVMQSAGKIGSFDPATNKFSEFDLPKNSAPTGITVDGKGVIWVTLSSSEVNAIGSFSPEAKKLEVHKIPSTDATPYMIAASGDGSIWFTERSANKIGRFKDGSFKEYKAPSPNSQPAGIVVDSKGSVWFTEAVGNNLAMLDPKTGKITEYRILIPYSNPADVAIDKNDRVWFVEINGNRIVMFEPSLKIFNEAIIPALSAVPISIAIAGNGVIWFTGNRANSIGSFDPVMARFQDYGIPTANSLPVGIAIDAGGRVWFTESGRDANKLGSITAGGVQTKTPPKSAPSKEHGQ